MACSPTSSVAVSDRPVVKPEQFRAAIEETAGRIAPYIRRTPTVILAAGEMGLAFPVTLKLECLQHTGSFKARGAFNKLLSNDVPCSGVNAASGGNHGVAVAYAARILGHKADIFVPEISAAVKIQRLREYGAQVNIVGENYAEALAASEARVAVTGALVVHAYDQPEALAGQGTTARELEEQEGEFDTILVAVGGGGFIGGIAAWHQGKTRVVAVEPKLAPTLHAAREAGAPVDVEVGGIAADALGARRIGNYAFDIADAYIDRLAMVEDTSIRAAQLRLWNELRIIAEPAGAAALAALTSEAYRPEKDERVAVMICGSNTDPSMLAA
jgi:threonine dehydratase